MRRSITFTLLLCGAFTAWSQHVELRDVATFSSELSDIWGYSDGTREYAIFGIQNAFVVADVTDPDDIQELPDAIVPGPFSLWRDIKTYGHYAYGVHDDIYGGTRQGLVIMDLSFLPDSLPYTNWTGQGSGGSLTEAHNIFIDESGIAYLSGHNFGGRGVLMLDLAANPTSPVIAGQWTGFTVHDCFARNDTLWTANGGLNTFSVVDVTDKANPVEIGVAATPGNYAHNIWLSDDGRTAFTTDESSGAFVAAHDVSDISNIDEIFRFRSNPGSGVVPHNVIVRDDYVIISYYRDGVLILDASQPDELVLTGSYDTSPGLEGFGYNGCWGVYPYLPSGTLLATDIERGLYVLSPDYRRAAHIRGTVTDALTGSPVTLANVTIQLQGASYPLLSDLSGKFKKGFAEGGAVTVEVAAPGYATWTDTRPILNGEVLDLDIQLSSSNYVGNLVWNDRNEDGLQNSDEPGLYGVKVRLLRESGEEAASLVTPATGLFQFTGVADGDYRLQYITPPGGDTLYLTTTADAGNDSLDSDVRKEDGAFVSPVFSVSAGGSYLHYDAGFIKQRIPDPIDTIHLTIESGDQASACDDELENGVASPSGSYICSASGDTAAATWISNSPGCIQVFTEAGNEGTLTLCLVTPDLSVQAFDTTVYSINVVNSVTGTLHDQTIADKIRILGNPSGELLRLKVNTDQERLTLIIRDASARTWIEARKIPAGLMAVPLDGLPAGAYSISVYSDGELLGTQRFFKY